jgi:hypothetical protein
MVFSIIGEKGEFQIAAESKKELKKILSNPFNKEYKNLFFTFQNINIGDATIISYNLRYCIINDKIEVLHNGFCDEKTNKYFSTPGAISSYIKNHYGYKYSNYNTSYFKDCVIQKAKSLQYKIDSKKEEEKFLKFKSEFEDLLKKYGYSDSLKSYSYGEDLEYSQISIIAGNHEFDFLESEDSKVTISK